MAEARLTRRGMPAKSVAAAMVASCNRNGLSLETEPPSELRASTVRR